MSSTDTLYLIFLVTGFTVGFGHCVGMCGPIVVSLSLNEKGGPSLSLTFFTTQEGSSHTPSLGASQECSVLSRFSHHPFSVCRKEC